MQRIIAIPFLSVDSKGTVGGECAGRGLVPLMVTDITIHVESAEGTLEQIDHSVTVLVELLKVVVEDLTCLGIWRSTSSAITAGVIPLRLLEHSMVRKVWFR